MPRRKKKDVTDDHLFANKEFVVTDDFLNDLILNKSNENSNIATNSQEAINLTIAENVLKTYALRNVFSREVAEAHQSGRIHLHDLPFVSKVYCGAHSIDFIKKYGIDFPSEINGTSKPAKHASVLTGHINTFLSKMQSFYAGALGLGFTNIFYAPFLKGMSFNEQKQIAQYLIFSLSQNSFSRGGQTLFTDNGMHFYIPDYLKNKPAIGPKGEIKGVYGDYEEESRSFLKAMLEVYEDGDGSGTPFVFPKPNIHFDRKVFEDKSLADLIDYTMFLGTKGIPYFVFDRGECSLSACCRLKTELSKRQIENLDTSRISFCGFQNVTINLPACAYNGKTVEGTKKEMLSMLKLVIDAHKQKRAFVELQMVPGGPLWELSRIRPDGSPYINLSDATYIVGIIGLNETVEFLTGKQLHESQEAYELGMELIIYLHSEIKKASKEHNLKFSIEETPGESASRRLAVMDKYIYKNTILRGSDSGPFYTNSIHYNAAAPIDLITRIEGQSRFHPWIESGAIIHAFTGEKEIPKESLRNLIEKVWYKTEAAQITISPSFTRCLLCGKTYRQDFKKCPNCGAEYIEDFDLEII